MIELGREGSGDVVEEPAVEESGASKSSRGTPVR